MQAISVDVLCLAVDAVEKESGSLSFGVLPCLTKVLPLAAFASSRGKETKLDEKFWNTKIAGANVIMTRTNIEVLIVLQGISCYANSAILVYKYFLLSESPNREEPLDIIRLS